MRLLKNVNDYFLVDVSNIKGTTDLSPPHTPAHAPSHFYWFCLGLLWRKSGFLNLTFPYQSAALFARA